MQWIDLLFPKRCPVCLTALPLGDELICPECRKQIRYVKSPTCFRCGKPLRDENKEYCDRCQTSPPLFTKGLSYAEYTSPFIRRFLAEVKYRENAQLLDFPCRDFAERTKKTVSRWQAEALIPVPLHESRARERGYNQAEEMARRLSDAWQIPVDASLLVRRKKTIAQKNLSGTERRENVAEAFVTTRPCPYERVILADDIYTTGSTADACTIALKNAGAKEVYFVSLAIGHD